MARTSVNLDVGDGRIRSLQSAIGRLNKELNRVYEKGQDNNYTVSNRDLTNLQRHLGNTQGAIQGKQADINQAMDSTKVVGNLKELETLTRQYQELADANECISQLFYGDNNLYAPVNNYRVSHSRAFKTNDYDEDNAKLANDIKELKHDIGRYSNRSKVASGRWNTAKHNGVITGEQYDKYLNTAKSLQGRYSGYDDRLKDLQKTYDNRYSNIQQQRNTINDQILAGDNTTENIQRRAGLDEELYTLDKYQESLVEMRNTLNKTDERIGDYGKSLHNTTGMKITPREDTLAGTWEHHKGRIIRGSAIAGIASLGSSASEGKGIILNNFDNVKSTAYATGQSDYRVENNMANAGFNKGMDLEQMSGFLNGYTSSTGNANLSTNQQEQVAGNWAGLSRYSGAKESTTHNLEYIAGLTALSSNPKEFSHLANQIQNATTNSGMNAKADEQQQALGNMYQIAATTGGPLSHQEQRNLAGFQGEMATMGSDMQGQNGLRAYQGLTQAFNSNSVTARMLFGAGDASTGTPDGQARLVERMQKATKNPYYYKTPIKNLLANASTQTNSKRGQRRIAASNLMELSKENGGNLTPDQAEKLVKMEQGGKFDKKHLNAMTKGNGKGKKDQYDKSGIKGLQKQQAARKITAKKAAHALNFFTRKLNWINHTFWIAPIVENIGSGIFSGIGVELFRAYFRNRGARDVLNDIGKAGHVLKYGRGSTKVAEEAGKESEENKGLGDKVFDYLGRFKSSSSGSKGINPGEAKTSSKGFIRGMKGKIKPGKIISSIKGLSRGKKVGLAIGAGMAGYALFNHNNKANASTRDTSTTNSNKQSKKQGRKHTKAKVSTKDIKDLRSTVKRKYKRLHKNEWQLIRHLNTYWDVFLRKAKEAGSSGDDSGGDASDANGVMSKDDFKKLAKKAAKLMHQSLSDSDIDRLYWQAFVESGVNPAIGGGVDDHDGTGLPVGLFQFKQSTWNTAQKHMPKGHNNIHSALDQIMAVLADSSWRSDLAPIGTKRGWTPHGYATGGIKYHATGDINQGSLAAATNNLKTNIRSNIDLSTIYRMSRIKETRDYIKPVRKQPKFHINIDVSQAQQQDSRSAIIDQTINDVFNGWISDKQRAKLQAFYSNETSGQLM